jgi:hypothetical protein
MGAGTVSFLMRARWERLHYTFRSVRFSALTSTVLVAVPHGAGDIALQCPWNMSSTCLLLDTVTTSVKGEFAAFR